MTARKQKQADCKCLQHVDEQLRPLGVRLQTAFQMDFENGKHRMVGPLLAIERISEKSRKKLPAIVAAYCPICGKKKPT